MNPMYLFIQRRKKSNALKEHKKNVHQLFIMRVGGTCRILFCLLQFSEMALSYLVFLLLLTVPRRCFFRGSFLLFMFRVCHAFCLFFFAALWSPVGKRLTSWLSCVSCFLVFLSLPHVVSWVRFGT